MVGNPTVADNASITPTEIIPLNKHLIEAERRQCEAERLIREGRMGDADRENAQKVRASLESQRLRLASLAQFTWRQEALFADAEDRVLVDGDGAFLPTYDWRPVPEGACVPPGLEVRLSFQGKQTIARIPPTWQLRLIKDDQFVRVNVSRDTRIANVLTNIGGRITLHGDNGALDPSRRFDAKLFRARQRLKIIKLA